MSLCCCVCSEVTKTAEDLRVHITVGHVHYIPLECHYCEHMFLPTLHSLTNHYAIMHPTLLPIAIATLSYDAEKAAEIQRLVAKSQTNSADESLMMLSKRKRQLPMKDLADEVKHTKQGSNKVINLNELNRDKMFKTENSTSGENEFDGKTGGTIQTHNKDAEKYEDRQQLNCGFTEGRKNEQSEQEHQNNAETTTRIYSDKAEETTGEDRTSTIRHNNNSLKSQPSKNTTNNEIEKHHDAVGKADIGHPLADISGIGLTSAEGRRNRKEGSDGPNHAKTNRTSTLTPLPATTYTITTGGRKGKRGPQRCLLCLKMVATKRQHIWSYHMQTQRFACSLCEYQVATAGNIKVHMWTVHSTNLNEYIDRKPDLREEYNQSAVKAFGDTFDSRQITNESPPALPPTLTLAIASSTNTNKQRSQRCLLCMKMVAGRRSSRYQHIWGNHVQTPRFECTHCGYNTAYSGKIKTHMRTKHPANHDDYIDRQPQLLAEYLECLVGAFDRTDAETLDLESPSNSTPLSKGRIRERHGQKAAPTVCALCGQAPFKNSHARSLHVWHEHMPTERYSCKICPVLRTNRSEIIKLHAGRDHAGDMEVIFDSTAALQEQYAEIRRRAFPTSKECLKNGSQL